MRKIKDPLQKFGMLGKGEGFTTVKELLWRYGNKFIDAAPVGKKNKKV